MATAHGRGWLELLLAGASGAELDTHRSTLLGSAPDDDRGRVEEDAARARQLSDLLREHKRHAEELGVLNDLARGLSTLRDPSETLAEVARQARRFLAVDVAYLMLLQADGKLRIETIDGSLGTVMRGIELGPGEGLGGRVLATGVPIWTSNYVKDVAIEHTSWLDRAAESEQLGGILGVPLLQGDATIGVLLAADRSPREFADREVALLAALASHAAVAIRNSHLFDETRSAAQELAEGNVRLRDTAEANQRAIRLHDRLMSVVLGGGGPAQVADALEDALAARIAVYDEQDQALASGRAHAGSGSTHMPPTLAQLLGSPSVAEHFTEHGAASGAVEVEGEHLAVTPVSLRERIVGSVVARTDGPLNADELRLLETGSTVIALTIASERAVGEAELRARGELVSAVLLGSLDEESLRRRARTAGVDLATVQSVVVLSPTPGDAARAASLVGRLASALGGWSAEHAGRAVALLREDDLTAVRTRLEALAGGQLPGTAGIAPSDGGTAGVRDSYRSADQCTAILRGLGRTASCALSPELGIYRTVFSRSGRGEIDVFVQATLGPLVDHDRAHRRDLVPTLEAYLAESRHHANTCARLHVHANTLYARLDRITEVLGEDWKDPERAFDLQLALRLRRLDATVGQGSPSD